MAYHNANIESLNALTMTTIEQMELIVSVIVKWFAMFEGVKHRGDDSSLHSNRDLLDHVGSGE